MAAPGPLDGLYIDSNCKRMGQLNRTCNETQEEEKEQETQQEWLRMDMRIHCVPVRFFMYLNFVRSNAAASLALRVFIKCYNLVCITTDQQPPKSHRRRPAVTNLAGSKAARLVVDLPWEIS